MNYSKPEVTVLGDAAMVIQGNKVKPGEGIEAGAPQAFELED
jgi:hypothetical protein